MKELMLGSSSSFPVKDLPLDSIGLHIQSSETEVNCIGKPLFVAESYTLNFDDFDPTVDAFGKAISDLWNDNIENAPQMFSDRFGCCFDGFKLVVHNPRQPGSPSLGCPCTVGTTIVYRANFPTLWALPLRVSFPANCMNLYIPSLMIKHHFRNLPWCFETYNLTHLAPKTAPYLSCVIPLIQSLIERE